jgi:hypothetical protein
MFREDRVNRILGVLRVLAMSVALLTFFAGAPQSAEAFYCEDVLLTCSTQGACEEVAGNECSYHGCEGEVDCQSEGWRECDEDQNFPIATVCAFEIG